MCYSAERHYSSAVSYLVSSLGIPAGYFEKRASGQATAYARSVAAHSGIAPTASRRNPAAF